MTRNVLAATLLLSLVAASSLSAQAGPCQSFEPYFSIADNAIAKTDAPGPLAFSRYMRAILMTSREDNLELARQITPLIEPGRPVPAASIPLASCLLRRYLLTHYGESMVKDLQTLVSFRTFATEGQDNWYAPEFERQREWLRKRAEELGLKFKSYDGRVDEITLTGPKPILAVLTHGDVQDVQGQQWSSPPWEAKIVDGRIIGRGTEDDKGPIVAALYSLAVLRDAGWPRNSNIRLLIANGEESSWAEIPYYLERAPMPDRTIGIDAAYPVTYAQKGYGVVTFRAQPVAKPRAGKWQVTRITGGSGMSIIPERGEALVKTTGDRKAALAELSRLAATWAQAHPPAKLTVAAAGSLLKITAEGRGGHSSEPESGHNALGDLTAFLATLDPRLDAWGSLAAFVGTAVGTETDGKALGIAHADEEMGALTSSLSFVQDDKGTPVARVNIRVPRGIAKEKITQEIASRAGAFTKRTGAAITSEVAMSSEPHYAPPEGPLVSTLLATWEEVTGTPGRPIAIGGGTQARLFQGGVDFGPALGMDHYRGHGTDEYLTVDELKRIGELTLTALWKLTGETERPAGGK
ncbi:MAG TPA: Sapep family Mn(2+)-dependent dipeptidase [Thermoanaerobaculia bacterium]|nr:Sapep family Mn(2+)-dependent dipeptidase [Thermoanaerobaculia bacterium]